MKIDEIKCIKLTLEEEEKEKLQEAIEIVDNLAITIDNYNCKFFQYTDCDGIDATHIDYIEEALNTLKNICEINEIY